MKTQQQAQIVSLYERKREREKNERSIAKKRDLCRFTNKTYDILLQKLKKGSKVTFLKAMGEKELDTVKSTDVSNARSFVRVENPLYDNTVNIVNYGVT
jgi:hypothetical protein